MTYRTRHLLFAALLGLLLGALAVNAVRAASRSSAAVIPASEFRPVGTNPHGESEPQRTIRTPILDPFPVSPPPERAAVEVPAAELVVREKATPRPKVAASGGVSGIASYYAWHVGEAAAGPALRVGDWRGRTVTVCASTCFAVVLNDFCQCYGNRVIDLSSNAFRRLAPLGIGVTDVTVTW